MTKKEGPTPAEEALKRATHGGAFWEGLGADFGHLDDSGRVISADVLDAWFDPSPKVIEKVRQFLPFALKTSPPTHCEGLIKVIAHHRGLPEDHILTGGGSSNLIFALFPNLLNRGGKVLILDPMYGEYAHFFENVLGARLLRHKLKKEDAFAVDIQLLTKEIRSQKPDMVVLVNPNSPTGQTIDRESLVWLVRGAPEKTIFVIDETYIDYVGKKASLEKETVTCKNLVVLKSMSKVYALSGARVGYMVAHPNIVGKVASFTPPWAISLIGQIAAVEALKDEAYYRQKYEETRTYKNAMIRSLRESRSLKIYDSAANFFLVELTGAGLSASRIVSELMEQDIYIRNCDSMGSVFRDNFIRIAVKDEDANKIVVDALKKCKGV